MAEIVASFTNNGVPATGLSATIRIRRIDTQALVVTDDPMTEIGEGAYSYNFAPVDGLEYSIRADGTATLPNAERYVFGALSGTVTARVEVDIPSVLSDTELLTEYDGGVWVQVGGAAGAVVGTNGTRSNPVGNDTDAATLAAAIGVRKYYVVPGAGQFSLTASKTNWEFVGIDPTNNVVNANGQDLIRCGLKRVLLTGTMGAGSTGIDISDGFLSNLSGFIGTARNCEMSGVVTMNAVAIGSFLRCSGFAGFAVDIGSVFSFVNVANFSGDMAIRNCTVAGSQIRLMGSSARFTLEATCTAGAAELRGLGGLVDSSGGGFTVDRDDFLEAFELDDVADAIWDEAQGDHVAAASMGRSAVLARYMVDGTPAVSFNDSTGSAGTVVGVNGTVDNPVDNEPDARAIATALGISAFNVETGFYSMGASYARAQIFSVEKGLPLVAINGQDVSSASFERVLVTGDLNGSDATFRDCALAFVTNAFGIYRNCTLQTSISCSGSCTFQDCTSAGNTGGGSTILDIVGSGIVITMNHFAGNLDIRNVDNANDFVSISTIGGRLTLAATCTDGNIRLSGTGTLVDNSAGTTVDASSLLPDAAGSPASIADAVWDELQGDHVAAGSMGESAMLARYMTPIGVAVTFDDNIGSAGTVLGVNGTYDNPCSSEADARAIATALGIKSYWITGAATFFYQLGASYAGALLASPMGSTPGFSGPVVDVNGQDVTGAVFVDLYLLGDCGDAQTTVIRGGLAGVTNFVGNCWGTEIVGDVGLGAENSRFYDCFESSGAGANLRVAFDCANLTTNIALHRYAGNMILRNLTGTTLRDATINLVGGSIELEANNTGGSIRLFGNATLIDNSAGSSVFPEGLIQPPEIRETLDWSKNRRRIDFTAGPPRQLVLYERDGVTEKFRMDLTTTNGSEVLAFFGVQHERGVPV